MAGRQTAAGRCSPSGLRHIGVQILSCPEHPGTLASLSPREPHKLDLGAMAASGGGEAGGSERQPAVSAFSATWEPTGVSAPMGVTECLADTRHRSGHRWGGVRVSPDPVPQWLAQQRFISLFRPQKAQETRPQGPTEGQPLPRSQLPPISAVWQCPPELWLAATASSLPAFGVPFPSRHASRSILPSAPCHGSGLGVLPTARLLCPTGAPLQSPRTQGRQSSERADMYWALTVCQACSEQLTCTPSLNPHQEEGRVIISLVQSREPRHREVRGLTRGHTAQKWLTPEPTPSPPAVPTAAQRSCPLPREVCVAP
nr:uncharacterized protein LOC123851918 [Mirounga angustirostris]XP_045741950.1 uncharacterized protein LOC123851918 [Mirounga angustirostris]